MAFTQETSSSPTLPTRSKKASKSRPSFVRQINPRLECVSHMLRKTLVVLLAVCLLHAQQAPTTAPPSRQPKAITDGWGTIIRGYRAPNPDSVRLSNSPRFENLIRDGKLYLTLQDAI